jgi:D-alanyl-D-alanine dipeptidase
MVSLDWHPHCAVYQARFLMKPYRHISIEDCGELLVPLLVDEFTLETPHPYMALGAPYGDRSPYFVRSGVLDALRSAQAELQHQCLGWGLQIVDAYRPIPVQQFMVRYTAQQLARQQGQVFQQLSESAQQVILEQVYQFWALPSSDPATPPPHSTGAAVDLTLVDAAGQVIDMGSPVDEVSPRSLPDHFADWRDRPETERDRAWQYHQNRQLLRNIMVNAGFRQHPNEWWHFSLGDQLWAWLCRQEDPSGHYIARYGRI